METYKNDFTKQEDESLWEIHEIRHQLSKEYDSMTIDEINKRASDYWKEIKKRKVKRITT